MSIETFAQAWLQDFFVNGFDKRVPQSMMKKLERLLDHLDKASTENDLHIAGFHLLQGDRKGTCSWRVTANWRLTFRFENGKAFDVQIEDYH
jgi:proteic killer suppression protein